MTTRALVIGIEQAGQMLGIGRSLSYKLAATGEWPTRLIRLGRRIMVPVAELESLVGAGVDSAA